mgnify:CR=1 FL=1
MEKLGLFDRVPAHVATTFVQSWELQQSNEMIGWEFESEIVGEGKRVSFEHGIPDKELQAQSSNLDDSTDETVLVILSRYPPPPSIRVTQTMETMWERLFRAHIEIGESIQNAAYFCLTVLEQKYGNRSLAAKNLNIDAKILSISSDFQT